MSTETQGALSRLMRHETPLRCLAGILALITFVGYTWFPRDDLSAWEKFYAFSPTLGLALGSALPNRFMAMVLARAGLPFLLIIGVARTVQDVMGDVRLPDGADYPAMVLRAFIAVTLASLLVRSFGPRIGNEAEPPTKSMR